MSATCLAHHRATNISVTGHNTNISHSSSVEGPARNLAATYPYARPTGTLRTGAAFVSLYFRSIKTFANGSHINKECEQDANLNFLCHKFLVPHIQIISITVLASFYFCKELINYLYILYRLNLPEGRDSSVGIATRYGLDGPGIESRWGRDFPHPSRQALGPTQPPTQWVPGLFPGDKAAGAWSSPPTLI
jgi:hypothetical protein